MADNNPYESILRADTAQAVRQSMQQAADLNPDTEAKLQGLARQYGVPVDAVRLEQPAMERRAKIDAIDYVKLAREAPATSSLMADPKRAAIAHDDLDSLHGAENVLKSWHGPKPSFASVAAGFAETLKYKPLVAGMRLWMNDLMFGAGSTPEDQVRRADLVRKAGQAQAQQDYSTPAFDSLTASGIYSGGVSILQNLPGLAASIATGSPAPGLAMAGLNSAAPAYGKYASRGATIGESAGGALAEGAVEVATEAFPMGFLVKNFGRVGAGQFLAGMLGREIPSEQAATFIQDAIDTAVANPDKTWAQFRDERGDAAYQTLIATLTQGAFMGGASKIAQVASGRAEQAQMAEEQASRIEAFNQFAAASKVMQRDQQTFEAFIAKASEGAPVAAVFIDARALLQSGVADQVAAASPSVAAQIAEAAQTGGTIAIPVEEYAARIAPTEAAGALLDHLRTTPDGFSRAEAQAYMQEQAPELEREVQRIITEKAQDESFKASAGVVKDVMRQQLDQVGRFTPEARDSYATVVGNFYAVQAAKLGVTPDALYERYPLTVSADEVGGNALDQGNVSVQFKPGTQFMEAKSEAGMVGGTVRDGALHITYSEVSEQSRGKGEGVKLYTSIIDKALSDGLKVFSDSTVEASAVRVYEALARRGYKVVRLDGGMLEDGAAYGRDAVEPAYEVVSGPSLNQGPAGKIPDTITIDGVERPTTNSKGQPIHPTEEGIRNFWHWFGDSKVVDKQGRPLVVYHGTKADFKSFDIRKSGASDDGLSGKGFYFTYNPDEASGYAESDIYGKGDAPNVQPVFVSLKNPLIIEKGILPSGVHVMDVHRKHGAGINAKGGAEIKKMAGDAGHDGVMWVRTDGGVGHVVVFNPEQIKSAIGNAGAFDQNDPNILHQGPRGAFTPDRWNIALLKGADLSTFLHETGHAFLEMQLDMAGKLQAINELSEGERGLMSDTDALLRWFGLRDLAEWQSLDFEERRNYHEKFARGFEAYLFEGKAPSIELQGLFQRFRAWLVNIYRDIKALNVELSDEVRGVMDRMIATGEQIKLAEMGRSMMPLFETAERAGMTADEFAAYQALGVQSTADAIEDLQARGLRDLQWIRNARGREIKRLQRESKDARAEVESAVRGEVMSRPEYQAWKFLTGKRAADNEDVTSGRIDIAALESIGVPAEVVQSIKARKMTAKNGGLHPDLVAEMFGFQSGDELVRTLAAANPPKEEIEALTDQRMLERFGELATPEAIERAADVAIHNAARGRMLATEANALAKATGQRKILTDAARQFAAAMVARLKVRDIRPSQYASAEARAGRAAQKASIAGDLEAAAAEKRNELVNHYAARAAYDAQDEVRSTLRNFSEFANRPDKRLGKTYDLDIANAARAILGEYGIAEKRAKKAGEYLRAVESYDPELYGVLRAGLEAAEANAKPVQDMTVEELRGLRDEIDAMLHLARRSRQMEVDGDLMDREDVENALLARLEEIGIPDTIPGEGQAVTPEEVRRAKLRTFIASARRVESWAGSMDGSVSMGPFRRFVFSRIKDAADAYRADKAAYLRRFRGLFDGIAPTLKPRLIAAPELGYTFGKDSGGSAMNEILHALLHTGNSSNKRKLLLGRGWAQQLPDGTLDTSRWDAFLRRMIVEEKITEAHFDFAQGVWDLLEDTKAGAQRTHRDVFGRYFDEVTAEPVQTPWGEYRGGYVPAMADARIVQDANLRALAEEDNAAMSYAFPTTPKGFTKARVEYNRPLTLDLRTLAQHIDKVLLFTHMEMPVRDVQRVMSKKVGQGLARVDPEAIPAMIQPWLNRAAKQQVETPIAGSAGLMRFFSVMRARAGAAAMFANVSNAAQQITGFALAAVKVRPGLMLSAAAEYIKAPRETARAVAESSAYMASRMDNEVAVMNGEINDILLNPSLLEQGQNWTMRHAYFLQAAVDNVTGPIIWTAAYNQALESGETERDAVRLADSAIRETQGSSLPEDISRIEGGNAFVRLFTQFAGYFNMQANLLGTEFVKIARDGGLRHNAGRGLYVLGLGFLAPAIVAEAIAQAFRGGPDDADKDGEYLDDWIAAVFGWAPLRNITAMVPVVGQGVNALINAANSKPYDDRLATSPAVSMLESAARAPFSAYKAMAEDGSGQKAVRDVATLISMTVGLPANLAARPVGYLTGVAEGRIDPVGPVDAVRGTLTGAASPESKR